MVSALQFGTHEYSVIVEKKMTKGEEGLLITNCNVSYCVCRDPKKQFSMYFFSL